LPNTTVEQGIFTVSGSLDGVRPGRHPVRILTVRRVSGAGALEGLAAFDEVFQLHLEHVDGVDLAPLGRMAGLRELRLHSVKHTDLAPLAAVAGLELLVLADAVDCPVPPRLELSATVREIGLSVDVAGATGAVIAALAAAIDWRRLSGLRALSMRVGGLERLPSIEVDLGFLRELAQLQSLHIEYGIRARRGSRSPLEPPFTGLPEQLAYLSVSSDDPEPLREALRRRVPGHVNVTQRVDASDWPEPWSIEASEDGYQVYGSLADLADGEFDTEYDALRAARRRLREADPRLLARLDFDHESSGTGITAAAREDLAAALRILGAG
jgi:hypothetical protein